MVDVGGPRGGEFVFADPATQGEPDTATANETRLYGPAIARSWNRLHPGLTHCSSWGARTATLPVIEGTVIRLDVAPPAEWGNSETGVVVALGRRSRRGHG
ncbi:hypothetical protein [Nocardia nova]|uniref:hypothetical protein n=1 Tax=Nocardia nova TaxID=37330 RepID=UPI0015E48D67|nr:hypothetical protein [Nocardia nova]